MTWYMKMLFYRKVLLIIITLMVIILSVKLFYKQDSDDSKHRIFGDYNKQYGLDIQKDGLFLGFKTESACYKTKNNISFWINSPEFDGFLLIKSLYNSQKNFHLMVLLDYSAVNFSSDSDIYTAGHSFILGPRDERIIHIGLKDIPLGAHDVLIIIREETNTGIENITCLHRTLYYNNERFGLSKKHVMELSKKRHTTCWYPAGIDSIRIFIEAEYLRDSHSCAVIAFNDNKQVLLDGDPFLLFIISSDKYSSAFYSSKIIKDFKGYLLLISEPFIPVEYPMGIINSSTFKKYVVIQTIIK